MVDTLNKQLHSVSGTLTWAWCTVQGGVVSVAVVRALKLRKLSGLQTHRPRCCGAPCQEGQSCVTGGTSPPLGTLGGTHGTCGGGSLMNNTCLLLL